MIKVTLALCVALLLTGASTARADSREAARSAEPVVSSAIVGQRAPDFLANDTNGQNHKLSGFKGKIVVLEWTNPECPFVHKFYDNGTVQAMQKDATSKGIIWLTISSSARGKEGFMDAESANRLMIRQKSHETARILDPTGTLGHLYGATSTPHMFVIDKNGILVYAGAMDDQPSTSYGSVHNAENYVLNAIAALTAGVPVAVSSSKPYGCSIKY